MNKLICPPTELFLAHAASVAGSKVNEACRYWRPCSHLSKYPFNLSQVKSCPLWNGSGPLQYRSIGSPDNTRYLYIYYNPSLPIS